MERSAALEIADRASQAESGSLVSGNAALQSEPFLLSTDAPSPTEESYSPSTSTAQYNVRVLDVTVATLLLLLVLPLMALCAVLVLVTGRGPILFRHPRIGRNGVVFECLKFRTMVLDAECAIDQALSKSAHNKDQWRAVRKLKCDPRVTPLGAFMRRYCLDELPQLFNVLAGQMSIVGPRPIVAAEIERYGANFPVYCSVKPGLTGLWQVSGRHMLSYLERVELDVAYVRSRTLSLDLLILCKTAPVVLCGENE
jgi:exopolysaccharide production protein ExoY